MSNENVIGHKKVGWFSKKNILTDQNDFPVKNKRIFHFIYILPTMAAK